MLHDVFGIPIKYDDWDKQDSLPFYIAASYIFHTVYIADKRCIMLTPIEELATIPALKKQIERIQEVDDVPIIFELKTVSPYRRKSLLENHIPFVTDKQIFLPFIGALLMDEKTAEPTPTIEKFMFSTQLLFLLYLYRKQKLLYMSEAGKILPFSAMTITRAVKQLETTGLFFVLKDGVNNIITSNYRYQELFKLAQKYLSTPVRKAGYIEKSAVTNEMVLAGETALAKKTMLNPSKITTYATRAKNFDSKLLTDELVDSKKQTRLELWAYDPQLLSNDTMADSLSIILSFSSNEDERIEQAIEQLTEMELKENGNWNYNI